MLIRTNKKKRGLFQSAANTSASGIVLEDNRTASVQRKLVADLKRRVTKKQFTPSPQVIQCNWKDEAGNMHDDDPPPGWICVNDNQRGEYWSPPPQEKSLESSERIFTSDKEDEESSNFELDSEEEIPEEELHRSSDKSYRDSRYFYNDKARKTRINLIERQSSPGRTLRSGFDGRGPTIPLDNKGREIRPHKKADTKNKQPDIDHMVDWVAIDEAVNQYPDSSMSSAEEETFKDYLYNYEPNLEILKHSEHTSKSRVTRENIPKGLMAKAKALVKNTRNDFKGDQDSKRRRNAKRKKSKKRERENNSDSE